MFSPVLDQFSSFLDRISPSQIDSIVNQFRNVIVRNVATFSRSEQTNGIQYKPKELGGMVLALLGKETAEEAADVSHTTESLAVIRRKAARLVREIRKGHLELNTRSISKSIVEEACDRCTTEDNLKNAQRGGRCIFWGLVWCGGAKGR